jgi:CspA family cold shock protein
VSDTTKHYGAVKFFGHQGKAFGFIIPDDGSKDVFVHISAVGSSSLREIKAGDRLEYTIEIDERSQRPCAANLKLIERAA